MMKIIWGLLGTLALTTAAHAVPVVIQVNGPDDKPVPNAEVRTARQLDADPSEVIFSARKPLYETARTDAKGVARFDWPEPKANVMPRARGKYVGTATVWAPNLGVANLILVTGDNRIKLPTAGIARGTVRDDKGAPVAGAQVRAVGEFGMPDDRNYLGARTFAVAPGDTTFTAITDAQGRWQIGNLPLDARALVQLEGEPYAADNALAPIVAYAAPVTSTVPAAPFAGVPDNINQNGELVAAPRATLTGRVLNPQGKPVAGVAVWAHSAYDHSGAYVPLRIVNTNAKGEYKLECLTPDTYTVTLRTPHALSLVADNALPTNIKIESGQTATVPDLKLIAGATINVQVTDAATGKPVGGAGVLATATDAATTQLGETDATGKLQWHVAPSRYRVKLWQPPAGYALPDKVGDVLNIAPDTNHTVEVKLQASALAMGRVVDEKGNAVPDTQFRMSLDRKDIIISDTITTDSKGEWKAQQFPAGRYEVSLQPNEKWQLVGPKTLEIPTANATDIKLKSIAQTQLAGRVLDSEGQGIAGVDVGAKIVLSSEGDYLWIDRQAVSDAQGNYTLPPFPVTARAIDITSARVGYALQTAPETKNANNVWSASDAVMQALSSHLGGTVVNAQNEPQKGVQVLAARFGDVEVSDAAGAWKFDALAPGETEIVAVGASGGAAQMFTAGRDDVQLKLQPFTPAKPRDVEGAIAVLDDAWQTSNGRHYANRDNLPAIIAPYDADAALAIARGGDDKASDAAVLSIVQVLAQADAERAREWSPQVLAGLEKPETQLSADFVMAKALADAHPEEAKTYLQAGSALYETLKDKDQKREALSSLATLSAKLKLPDAQSWFERALATVDDKNSLYRDYQSLAWQVGAVSVDWATQVIEAAIKAAPEPQAGTDAQMAAAAAIRRVARWDVDAAQQLMDKYGSLRGTYGSDYEMEQARAALTIAHLKKDGDVDAALKSARKLRFPKIDVLLQIAVLAPVAARAEILRETLKLARANGDSQAEAIQVAWQLLPYDHDLAQQTLDEIRLTLNAHTPNQDPLLGATDTSWWAFAYRSIEPTQARWLLERDWARINYDVHRVRDSGRSIARRQLILAMATIDVTRARQMIFALPVDEQDGAPFDAAQALARWMLFSDEERQTRPFDAWNRSLSQDSLYGTNW